MRIVAAARPPIGRSCGLRITAVARPSPRSLSAKRAAAAPPSRALGSKKKNGERPTIHATRGPIAAASASSPSPSSSATKSSSSSSGDEDEACDVYVTPEGEVVEVRL